MLLASKAGSNARDLNGVTPIMLACEKGHSKIVRLLLNSGEVIREYKDDILEGTALHWHVSMEE